MALKMNIARVVLIIEMMYFTVLIATNSLNKVRVAER